MLNVARARVCVCVAWFHHCLHEDLSNKLYRIRVKLRRQLRLCLIRRWSALQILTFASWSTKVLTRTAPHVRCISPRTTFNLPATFWLSLVDADKTHNGMVDNGTVHSAQNCSTHVCCLCVCFELRGETHGLASIRPGHCTAYRPCHAVLFIFCKIYLLINFNMVGVCGCDHSASSRASWLIGWWVREACGAVCSSVILSVLLTLLVQHLTRNNMHYLLCRHLTTSLYSMVHRVFFAKYHCNLCT